VVVRCELLGYELREVPVRWEEVEGSKLTEEGLQGLVWNGVGMLRDMICVRLCYMTGGWKVERGRKGKGE
jgi:dolichyl-phosphate beta-glucosyltransferase